MGNARIELNVIYNGNGHTDGTVPKDNTIYGVSSLVTVQDNTGHLINIDGITTAYRFNGWNTKPDGSGIHYSPGDTFVFSTDDINLYAQWTPYAIGDTGPAGGWIFYDKGVYSNGWRYLEAAPIDQAKSNYGSYPFVVPGADGTAIGTGEQNTQDLIVGDSASAAAHECYNYSVTSGNIIYDDWFLPSRDELEQMYINLHQNGVGGFINSLYWSSSEYAIAAAWMQHFGTGTQYNSYKSGPYCVRAIRYF